MGQDSNEIFTGSREVYRNKKIIVEDSALNYNPQQKDDCSVQVTGAVRLQLFNKEGTVLKEYGSNKVTFLGKHRLARIVCGNITIPSSERVINTIRISDGAVTGDLHLNPIPANATDTGLFQTTPGKKIVTLPLEATTFPVVSSETPPVCILNKVIISSVVDMLVNEAGLFFGTTGPIFAHHTFPTMDLRVATNNSLRVEWELLFK